MPTRVVILGAGFGGLELSTRLSEELAGEVEVTLIDQSDAFVFGFSKLDVMFGRRTSDEVRLSYRHIAKPGVEFRQETVVSIDPDRKRVVTNRGTHDADILVVALGADLDPEATPGLVDTGHEFWAMTPSARSTSTSCPDRHRPRCSHRRRSPRPTRSACSPPPAGDGGSAATNGGIARVARVPERQMFSTGSSALSPKPTLINSEAHIGRAVKRARVKNDIPAGTPFDGARNRIGGRPPTTAGAR